MLSYTNTATSTANSATTTLLRTNTDYSMKFLIKYPRQEWTVNYKVERVKLKNDLDETETHWGVSWAVINPGGTLHRASEQPDVLLAYRCMNEEGQVDKSLIRYEFGWWINHYCNVINLPARKVLPAKKAS